MQTDQFWTLSWPFSCDYSFWLRDLKFGMCIKDFINKTCWKNGKDCQTGLLKLNFETRPKKHIFRFLPKISAGHGWSWKFFFANFQILGPLGCQGWVVIPQNVKKVKITAPYCISLSSARRTVSKSNLWKTFPGSADSGRVSFKICMIAVRPFLHRENISWFPPLWMLK